MFNLEFRITTRGLKQIEALLSTQSFEDVIDGVFDAPAQTRAASVYFQLPGKTSAPPLTEKRMRSAYSGYFSKKRATEAEICNRQVLSVQLT